MNSEKVLKEVIPQFAEDKKALENYKQITDKEKKKIKWALNELGQSEYTAYGYKVKLTKRTTQQLDEDGLISYLQNLWLNDSVNKNLLENIVKTKFYLDTDALEKAIYSGAIPQDNIAEMSKYTKEKVSYAVSIANTGD